MNLSQEFYSKHVSVMESHINIGTGSDLSIKDLTEKIARIVGFKGQILWDSSKPDGPPRKLLDVEKLNNLCWSAQIDLDTGLERSYQWFLENYSIVRL